MSDLGRYRWHTGAPLRRVENGEPIPLLFRDIGTHALATFLRGGLRRLAGPMTPLTYLRTSAFREPYIDHEKIGRIVILDVHALAPWHSGVPHVYVADATRWAAAAFVPGDCTGADAPVDLADLRGGTAAVTDALARLDALHAALEATERRAAPLRRALQGPERDEARIALERMGLREADLCTAWHHLPRERRDLVAAALG